LKLITENGINLKTRILFLPFVIILIIIPLFLNLNEHNQMIDIRYSLEFDRSASINGVSDLFCVDVGDIITLTVTYAGPMASQYEGDKNKYTITLKEKIAFTTLSQNKHLKFLDPPP